MKLHLVSGGCGFVGRNLVKRLLHTTSDIILNIDDLSVGLAPDQWLPEGTPLRKIRDIQVYGKDERLYFWKGDFRHFLRRHLEDPEFLKKEYGLPVTHVQDAYHFAAIVGGRAKIEGDPMMVAQDLSIDAGFFAWACQHKPKRALFPSSSAAYPVDMQTDAASVALPESAIDFESQRLGMPDMTYGWSKLTGEYLARIAAAHYGISVASVRPFSGYGEDQDLSYPIPAIAARAAKKEDPFEVWGTGKQGRDFVHIDDCIDCILMAMDKISDGSAINIGAGRLTNFLEIIDIFTDFAGYEPEIKKLLDKPVGVHARYADMTYVKNKYGWEPKISLQEGLKRVYDKAVKKYA